MTISKVTAKNLQSHKETVIEFHPGFNVIRGDTDSGKSAFMRGFRFCAFNSYKGNTLNSFWGGDTEFRIDLTDGNYVNRIRGKKNLYDVNGEILSSFKTDVPDEVNRVLNFNEVNLQRQLDGHFLINDTGGQVAKYFNKIANLDKIDISNKNIKSEISKTKQQITFNESELDDVTEKAKAYEYLDEAERQMSLVEVLSKEKQKKLTNVFQIDSLLDSIESIHNSLDKLDILQHEESINNLVTLLDGKNKKIEVANQIDLTINSISNIESELSELEKLTSIETTLNKLIKQHTRSKNTKQKQNKIARLIKSMSETEKELKTLEIEIVKLDKRWHDEMPDICPLCGK